MFSNLKFWGALVGLVCIAAVPMTDNALAVSVEIAKKCNALTGKAFPPRVLRPVARKEPGERNAPITENA
jgi:hypothetical protein